MVYGSSAYAKIEPRENSVNKHVRKMNSEGFTLLEVTLFLAIAGLLSVIAIVGLGPRLNNVRFSAAVRDFESNVASNLADTTRGTNTRTGIKSCQQSGDVVAIDRTDASIEAGGASTCVINGTVAVFDKGGNRVLYRRIVSLRESVKPCTEVDGFRKILVCNKATLLDEGAQTKFYNYINGLTQTSPTTNVGFGYIQDPNGTTIYPFRSTPKFLFSGSIANSLNTFESPAQQTEVCYSLGSRQAKVVFNNTSLKPEVRFGEVCS